MELQRSINRRQLLSGTLGVGAGLWLGRQLPAAPAAANADRFVLLSDTHIPADPQTKRNGISPVEQFLQVRGEILALEPRPAAIFLCGDCVLIQGMADDYVTLRKLLDPLRQAGIPLHLAVGNHDDRQNLWKAFPELRAAGQPPVADKHVTVVESRRANWILLDSLDHTNVTPGKLGQEQLDWLARTLDAQPNKPALIMIHHNLDPLAKLGKSMGLIDTDALRAVLVPRRQVKALIYGHTHRWEHSSLEGMHLINLPTTAWLFDKKQPQGWVDAQLRDDGLTLKLQALDKQHPAHGETLSLKWR